MKPMLAAKADLTKLRYPVLVSPKLDGIRCLISDGVALSRSLKPIPNQYVQDWVKRRRDELEGLDGELIVGSPTAPDVYNVTQSGVMSVHGRPDFFFYAFDQFDRPAIPYRDRFNAPEGEDDRQHGRLIYVYQYRCNNEMELLQYEQWFTERGYEGVMIRDPMCAYKYGRSTVKDGCLLKLKRFEDSEAVITGFQEKMHNANESTTDNLGHVKRSSAKSGLVPTGTLGSFEVRDIHSGVQFACGTGLSSEQRRRYWDSRDGLVGKIIKYRYLPVGVKTFESDGVLVGVPRHPVFLGFRDERDL